MRYDDEYFENIIYLLLINILLKGTNVLFVMVVLNKLHIKLRTSWLVCSAKFRIYMIDQILNQC